MKTTILFGVTMAMALTGSSALAQTHKVTAPDSVVRAIGVYEWTGDLTKPTGSRLVPVTLFINGHLEDAGVYMPRPVPFALVSGNVYELEDAGLAKGVVELESAIHMTAPDAAPGPVFDEGWTGYGNYKPPAPPRRSASASLRPAKTLPVIQTSSNSDKPHFSNKGDSSKPADSSTAGSQTDASKKTDPAAKPDSGASADDPDRPTMKRHSPDDSTASTEPSSQTTSTNDEAERPTLKRRSPEDAGDSKNKKKNDVATVTAAGSLNDDPDRPTLHHGNVGTAATEMPKLSGLPKDMHQMVAVSDAKDRDPHPFARPWEDPNERPAVLAKMQAFARAKLTEYGIVPGLTPATAITSTSSSGAATPTSPNTEGAPPTLKRGIPTSAKTPSPAPNAPAAAAKAPAASAESSTGASAKSRRTASKTPPLVELADEDLKGYLLSYGGAPTYVYMAHTVETASVMRYVTVVAQADALGEVKLAMSSVTDAAHLDRTPWMRLVDAVDVEASNRASLLFELRGQSSRQFALYRVIATKPEQIFVTSSGL
jgi:hypothetical protein